MNQRPFIRKIIYLAILVLLLIPLSLLSMPSRPPTPAEPGRPGEAGSKGGKLAQLRDEYKLGQANLGQIDPTSEAIKLATLGMRGFAATIMWNKANTYKMKEDWTGLSAALEQIIKLQPNFVTVWQFQGWNLAYNISYEFDDYRERYFWVIKGVRFLQEGMKYNETAPKLVEYVGWVISQKIGIADEKVQFRRLFREDNDFHGSRPIAERDNWLVGRQYYLEAEQMARNEDMLDKLNPLVFLFHAPKALINYAIALEEDGVFEERATVAWNTALNEWQKFGQVDIRTTEDRAMRLNDFGRVSDQIDELVKQLDALPPAGRRELIYEEKLAALPQDERDALKRPAEQRSSDEHRLAASAQQKAEVTSGELAERVDPQQREAARELAKQIDDLKLTLHHIDRGREVLNYPYWLTRCEMECRPETIEARRLMYQADKALADNDLNAALDLYEQGFAKWDEALKDFPTMRKDNLFGDDLAPFIKRYRVLLKERDASFPDDFPLSDILGAQREKGNINE